MKQTANAAPFRRAVQCSAQTDATSSNPDDAIASLTQQSVEGGLECTMELTLVVEQFFTLQRNTYLA